MIHYVAGLLFDTDHQAVVLILKDHGPASLVGKWNAVGGKILSALDGNLHETINLEHLETPVAAMHREFLEETGVAVAPRAWTKFLTFHSALPDGADFTAGMSVDKVDAALASAYAAYNNAWTVDFFHAALPLAALKRARTMETEQVRAFQLFELRAIPDDAFVRNLRWIVPMALHHSAFPEGAVRHVACEAEEKA